MALTNGTHKMPAKRNGAPAVSECRSSGAGYHTQLAHGLAVSEVVY